MECHMILRLVTTMRPLVPLLPLVSSIGSILSKIFSPGLNLKYLEYVKSFLDLFVLFEEMKCNCIGHMISFRFWVKIRYFSQTSSNPKCFAIGQILHVDIMKISYTYAKGKSKRTSLSSQTAPVLVFDILIKTKHWKTSSPILLCLP